MPWAVWLLANSTAKRKLWACACIDVLPPQNKSGRILFIYCASPFQTCFVDSRVEIQNMPAMQQLCCKQSYRGFLQAKAKNKSYEYTDWSTWHSVWLQSEFISSNLFRSFSPSEAWPPIISNHHPPMVVGQKGYPKKNRQGHPDSKKTIG